jgi:hypothetical protein
MSEFDRVGVWLRVAAALMAGAGLVHASAAGQHADHPVLAAGFAACAAAQIAWAVAAAARPGRQLAGIGVALAPLTVGAWAFTRVVAIEAIDGLDVVQDVGAQDLLCVGLELAAGVAALAAVARLRAIRPMVPLAALGALALALPASAMSHEHGGAAHSADHTANHTAEHTAAGAASGAAAPEATVASSAAGNHEVASSRPPTRQELARAAALVETTTAALARYKTTADVEAAGYRSIGDAATGFEHFVNRGYLTDGRELDPERIESIVFRVEANRTKTLVSGMYILEDGKTMADVPEVGGPLTLWHDHQNLCWDANGRVVGVLRNGSCFPRGTFAATAPMLHVWLVDHPCGPFAGIEGNGPLGAVSSHGGGCGHGH